MESRVENSYHDSEGDRRGSPKITVGSLPQPGSPTQNGFDSPLSNLEASIKDLGAESQIGVNSVFNEIISQ